MITFLRKIRKSLIDSGATRKYLLYAIGEIALVVIGILIALQINNWNEGRKDRVKENLVMIELVSDLEVNLQRLRDRINWNKRCDQSSDIIFTVMNNDLNYNDTLDVHFSRALDQPVGRSMLSYVAYESIRNEGFDIIKNNQLRNEIINLFEETYHQLGNSRETLGKTFTQVISLKHEHFLRKANYKYAPFDLEDLKKNKQFYSWLSYLKDTRLWVSSFLRDTTAETERVLQLIKDELGGSDRTDDYAKSLMSVQDEERLSR